MIQFKRYILLSEVKSHITWVQQLMWSSSQSKSLSIIYVFFSIESLSINCPFLFRWKSLDKLSFSLPLKVFRSISIFFSVSWHLEWHDSDKAILRLKCQQVDKFREVNSQKKSACITNLLKSNSFKKCILKYNLELLYFEFQVTYFELVNTLQPGGSNTF
jgi:hypothetical protein